jgi:hypothetical protein
MLLLLLLLGWSDSVQFCAVETETAGCQGKGEEIKAGAVGVVDDAKGSLSHEHIPVSVAPSTAYAGPSRSDPPRLMVSVTEPSKL